MICGVLLVSACAAVYPEVKTPLRAPVEGKSLDTPPPDDLYYIYFDGAVIPRTTLDGRKWSGNGPDPFAKLLVDGEEILLTPVESGTRKPTWPGQRKANYRISDEAKVTVEMWDSNPGPDHPLCKEELGSLERLRGGLREEIQCVSGARLFLVVEKARPMVGSGFYYELRGSDGARITRVIPESPAGRAGLQPGDRIVELEGNSVSEMEALAIRSTITKNLRSGLELTIVSSGGKNRELVLEEGAIYPLPEDGIQLPKE